MTVGHGMKIPGGSLVLYKSRAAKVVGNVGEKITIHTQSGTEKKVRQKDVVLLHPGPFAGFGELTERAGDVEEAWEMLEGETTTLAELAELVFGEFTAASAWSTWVLLADGLYFQGMPEAIRPRPECEVRAVREEREARVKAEQEWRDLLERINTGRLQPGDEKHLSEVERLAFGDIRAGKLMKALQRPQTPEGAHALLLKLGYWDEMANPQARRRDVPLEDPDLSVPDLPCETRLN